MPVRIDQPRLFLCMPPPEQERHRRRPVRHRRDDRIRHRLPAPARMGIGRALGHCQHAVQEQHALRGPGSQIAALGWRLPQIVAELAENVAQRARRRHARPHREAQPVRMTRRRIGVLPEDHRPDPGRRCLRQSTELRAGTGRDRPSGAALGRDARHQQIGPFERLRIENRIPAGCDHRLASSAPRIASPISVVEIGVPPSGPRRSGVRAPWASTVSMAFSSRVASAP